MTTFAALDIETANYDLASICQIGVAVFERGEVAQAWSTLVNPEEPFTALHTSVHGLTEQHVRDQPKLPQVERSLRELLTGRVTVCHTHFDRTALDLALAKYQLGPLVTSWLDTAKVARRTWREVEERGYGLADLCGRLGHEFRHHDALEDAKAAGFVLLAAMRESGRGLDEWLVRVTQPIRPPFSARQYVSNPDGHLYGEVVVFTGALELPRREAASLAADLGCRVSDSVTRHTSMLVVGDQDLKKLAGHAKSSKHRKAEELAARGQQIRILQESDFKCLVGLT